MTWSAKRTVSRDLVFLGCLLLAGCSGLGALPTEFAGAAAEPGGPARIELLEGGAVAELAAPISSRELPHAVEVAVEAVQPGGEVVSITRIWSPDRSDPTYRVVVEYGDGGRKRSVHADATGHIIERSHEVAPAEISVATITAVHALRAGAVERIEVLQRAPGTEYLRFWLSTGAADGTRTIATCRSGDAPGPFSLVRVVDAELWLRQN